MRRLLVSFLLVAFTQPIYSQVSFQATDPGITPKIEAIKAAQGASGWWSWSVTIVPFRGASQTPDLVFGNHGGSVNGMIFRKNAAGEWEDVTPTIVPGSYGGMPKENRPVVMDFNGDGFVDLLSTGNENSQPSLKNTGTALETMTATLRPGWGTFEVSDLNNDGRLDAVSYSRSWGVTTKRTAINNSPEGKFDQSTEPVEIPEDLPQAVKDEIIVLQGDTGTGNRYAGMIYQRIDLNGDSREDMIVQYYGNYGSSSLRRGWYLFRNEAGDLVDYTAACGIPSGLTPMLPARDINGDGLVDIIGALGSTSQAGLYRQNAGTMTFTRRKVDGLPLSTTKDIWGTVYHTSAYYGYELRWIDFDGDGDLDLFVSRRRLGSFAVFECNDVGDLIKVHAGSHGDAEGFDIADINGDNKLDIVTYGNGSGHPNCPVMFHINTSEGTVPPPPPPAGTIKVIVDGVTLPAGTTVKIDGVEVTPPTTGEKVIEVMSPGTQPVASGIPKPDIDVNSRAWQRYAKTLTSGTATSYAVTGLESHRLDAIAAAEKVVDTDTVAGNQYLGANSAYSTVFQAYSWCNPTDAQKIKWAEWGKRHLGKPDGSIKESIWWSSRWARNNPANNYYHSFVGATTAYAMATGDPVWMAYLKDDRLPKLYNYYNTTPEGGSREGTGYGESHRTVAKLAALWRAYDGTEILPEAFIDASILYWVHATTPDLKWVALIGDHTRAHGKVDGYHRHIVGSFYLLSRNEEVRNVALWYLNNVPQLTSPVFYPLELVDYPAGGCPPKSLLYWAKGAGHFFYRTSWNADATYIYCTAGKYDEAHQQQDQGAFGVFHKGWQTCSDSPWTHGGIAQETDYQNVVRFASKQQKHGKAGKLNWMLNEFGLTVDMDLTEVVERPWTRKIVYTFGVNELHITDVCQGGAFGFCKPESSTATVNTVLTENGMQSVVSW